MKHLSFWVIAIFLFGGCVKGTDPITPEPDSPILWGSSVWVNWAQGETKEVAYQRVKTAFGQHDILRQYETDPVWPSWIPKEATVQISFKINPAEVLNGSKDAVLTTFFEAMSSNKKVYWTYFHEPEDDIKEGAFTAEQYRNAFDYIINLQKSLNKPNLVPTLCLMSYSLTPESNRNWRDYLPTKVELLSWDGYYRDNMNLDVAKVFDKVRAVAVETGLPWAVAETGVNKMKKSGEVNEAMDIETRKQLLTALSTDIKNKKPRPVYVSYFDSDPSHDAAFSDWRISDDPTMVAAWKAGWK